MLSTVRCELWSDYDITYLGELFLHALVTRPCFSFLSCPLAPPPNAMADTHRFTAPACVSAIAQGGGARGQDENEMHGRVTTNQNALTEVGYIGI